MRWISWICCLAMGGVAAADDWPQWMGPQRDNVWRESGIVDKFPAEGPRVLWRQPVAGGYSGPAVANGRVFVTDYVTRDNVKVDNFARAKFTGTERVLCLDEKSGETIWTHAYPVEYTISYPAGPRCTPIVHEGRVYTLGAEGHLMCFQFDDGEVIWQRNLLQEYETKVPLWGYAAHPLIDGDRLICVVGGEESHAVAFDKDSGKQIWAVHTAQEQGYSPPTIVQAAGRRQLLLVRPDGVSSVDPETGAPLWTAPYEATNGSIIMSPILKGEHLYVGGYSQKNLLLKLTSQAPGYEVVWRNIRKQAISPVNVQPILVDDTLYGMDQNGQFLGVDFMTGEHLWETAWPLDDRRPKQTGTAFIVRQDARFWLFTEQGDLMIAQFDREGYQEISTRARSISRITSSMRPHSCWSAIFR